MYNIVNIRPFGSNVGNHVIHLALRQMLYETFGRLVSIVEIPAAGNLSPGSNSGITAETVHEINRYADGVIVGGGNLYENNALTLDVNALRALEPPMMLFSNSWGRIYNRFRRLSIRSDAIPQVELSALLDRADISLSRDSVTHAYAKSLNAKDCLGWCPTIALSRYRNLVRELPEDEEVGALISVRTPSLMNVPYRLQGKVQGVTEQIVTQLKKRGHRRVRILCNDKRDLDFAASFRYSVGVDAIFASDAYEYLSLIDQASLIVSFRLHATLPAISLGTPVINISYDERAAALLKDLGVERSSLDMIDLGENLTTAIENHIVAGGYTATIHRDVDHLWSSMIDSQLGAFQKFRLLVGDYVGSGNGD